MKPLEQMTVGEQIIALTSWGYRLEIGRHPKGMFDGDMAKLNGMYYVIVYGHNDMRLEGDSDSDLPVAIAKAAQASFAFEKRVRERAGYRGQ